MPRARPAMVCRNCDAPAARLGRLVRVAADGRKLHLSVCRPRYLRLDGARRRGDGPPPAAPIAHHGGQP